MNDFYGEDKLETLRIAYESMRLQTYFIFSLQVAKQHKKTFKAFCNQLMPFEWDKDKNPKEKVEKIDWVAKQKEVDERIKKSKTTIAPLNNIESLIN